MISLFVLFLFLGGAASAASATPINDLINYSSKYTGQTVTVEGEAIGEVLARGDYAWVNINDGTNAIGIWMKLADAQKIQVFGNYKNKGDTLRVTGLYSTNCTEHGGDVDIHAADMTIVKQGGPTPESISPAKIAITVFFVFIALAVGLFYKRVMSRSHRTE